MKRYLLPALFFAATLALSFVANAEEEKKKPDTPPAKEPLKKPHRDLAEEPDADEVNISRYKLPEDVDAQTLMDYCVDLQDYEADTDEEAKEHEERAPAAIKRACQKILELEKDQEVDTARFARRTLLTFKLDKALDFDSAKTTRLLKKIETYLFSPKACAEDVELASALADFLGDHVHPKSIELAEKIGKKLGDSADSDLAEAGRTLQGTARRLA